MSEQLSATKNAVQTGAAISSGPRERFATAATNWSGRNSALALAIIIVAGWLIAGPLCKFSDRWELSINTITSIVTFLMVFVIQRAQNKDTLALQLKLNELIASHKRADNTLIAIERLSEDELRALHERFVELGAAATGLPPPSIDSAGPHAA